MYKKDNICMPGLVVPNLDRTQSNTSNSEIKFDDRVKVPSVPVSSLENKMCQDHDKSEADSFRSYLDSFTESAKNFDISDALSEAVDQIKSFPKNSVAFYWGVKEVLNLAKKEVGDVIEMGSVKFEQEGYLKTMKLYALASLNKLEELVSTTYEKVSEVSSSISKVIFGERLHESLTRLMDQYLKGFGNFLMENLKSWFASEGKIKLIKEEGERSTVHFENSNTGSVKDSGFENSKESLLTELVERSSAFLSYSKEYFAHNILDDDSDLANKLKPEMLVEGDLRSRPIYDLFPPEWVTQKMAKVELSERARKGTEV